MSTASEPEPAAEEDFASCAVCGRTILRGERLHDYVDADRATQGVCALCKPHAEAAGWVPAALVPAVERDAAPGRRRGIRLRELLTRRSGAEVAPRPPEPSAQPAGAAESDEVEAEAVPTATPDPPRPEPEAAPEPEPEPPPSPPSPLEVFNVSENTRTVAGVMRTLGEPRATVRPTAEGELITVGWELSWYQWRVSDGQVSEVAKGGELSELADEDRAWNASATEDGQLVLD